MGLNNAIDLLFEGNSFNLGYFFTITFSLFFRRLYWLSSSSNLIQIFFPKKVKTAKYAGNWDPKARQPFTYKLQRWILSNTFLTKNIQVLVYGDWENQTKNIKPFFTATYSESEILNANFRIQNKDQESIKFLFVGTLSKGKQPLYAIQIVEELFKKGKNVTLDLFGDGA